MSYIARTRKVLPNAFLFFIEKGVTSESNSVNITVDALAKPDNSPTTNWPARPCTLELDIMREIEEDKVKCPSESGGWQQQTDYDLVGVKLAFTERTQTEHFERLLWVLPNKVTQATAQMPFTGSPSIEGWLKIVERNRDGTDLIYCDLYGQLTLKGGTKVDGKHTRPQFEFEVFMGTALNSWMSPT
jgi:hypothetical protein